MTLHPYFATTLGMRCPIIQAPMAGGPTSPDLVAAVSNAGGLGGFAAAMLAPQHIEAGVTAIRARTDRAFAVNLFVLPPADPAPHVVAQALGWLAPLYEELGVPPVPPARWCEDGAAQLETVLALRPRVVSFTFGIVDHACIERFHRAGTQVIGTATTVAEAQAWRDAGADAVCVQGAEAGGHRGTFLGSAEQSMIGTLALVPQVADAVDLPVIAAGGIMDGRGVAAVLALGAGAAQLGTAFLSCPEAPIHALWKQALAAARDDATRVTRLFSGRPARGLANGFMDRMAEYEALVPAYPVQNALTAALRQAAARQDRADCMSLWAGQGAAMSRVVPAAALVALLSRECEQVLARLAP
jgi:nitronate monooxygenase